MCTPSEYTHTFDVLLRLQWFVHLDERRRTHKRTFGHVNMAVVVDGAAGELVAVMSFLALAMSDACDLRAPGQRNKPRSHS